MPADINKTIEIAYRADVKNIIDGLTKTGKISEKEAQRISKSLEQAYAKAARDSEKAAKKQQESMAKTTKSAKSMGMAIGKSMAGITAGIAAASVAAIAFGQHIADMSNQLVDASTKTGVNVDTLNGLRLAAEGAGLSFEELEAGLIKLPQMMTKAADGSKAAQQAFEKLGVQTTETVDGMQQLRSADDVLKDIFHSLQRVESAEQKAAMAAEIFGRNAGPKFVQSGAIDNLENFVALAEEFGVSTGPNMQQNMADFQRVTATAMSVVQGEFMRFMDVLAGKEAGAGGGLVDIILGATEAIVYFGTVTGDVFRGFQAGFGIILAELNLGLERLAGTTSDVERAMIVLQETVDESQPALQNFFSPFEQAEKRLDSFREKLKATMTAPSGDGGTTGPTGGRGGGAMVRRTTKQVDELAETTRVIDELNASIDKRYEEQERAIIERLSGEERIRAEYQQRILMLDDEEGKARDLVQTELDRLSTIEQTAETREKMAELEEGLELRLAQIREQRIEESMELDQQLLDFQLENLDILFEKEMEQDEKRLENIEKERKAREQLYADINKGIGMTIQGIQVAGDLVETFGEKNKQNAELAFNIRKAAAIAEIVVQTATNVVEAFPNPFLMTAATALGVAQGAVVAAEQPSFHMGGMIGNTGPLAPDETMVRAKQGEAILSTNAVRNLGGSQGVEALERGGGMKPTIVVVNPFKHYDRFIKGRDAMGMGIASTGRKGY